MVLVDNKIYPSWCMQLRCVSSTATLHDPWVDTSPIVFLMRNYPAFKTDFRAVSHEGFHVNVSVIENPQPVIFLFLRMKNNYV